MINDQVLRMDFVERELLNDKGSTEEAFQLVLVLREQRDLIRRSLSTAENALSNWLDLVAYIVPPDLETVVEEEQRLRGKDLALELFKAGELEAQADALTSQGTLLNCIQIRVYVCVDEVAG